jgi:hypothetical protein
MPDDELLERVRELRARGRSPKEIARALKVRPAIVTPLIRRLAAAEPQEEAPLVGCWVNQGWSSSVRFTGHPEWPDTGPAETGESGLVIVVVARERGSPDDGQHTPGSAKLTAAGTSARDACSPKRTSVPRPLTWPNSNGSRLPKRQANRRCQPSLN